MAEGGQSQRGEATRPHSRAAPASLRSGIHIAALHLAVYRALEIIVGVIVATGVDYALADGSRQQPASSTKPGICSLPVDRDLMAVALAGGIAIALIPFIWNSLELPGLGQTPITAFVIVTALHKEPGRKAATRALGCLLGGACGLLMMHVVGDQFLPWLAALSLGIFISANLAHGESDASYVGLQSGLAVILAMVQGSRPSPDIVAVLDRLAGIFGGILVVAIVLPILRPLIRHGLDRAAPDVAAAAYERTEQLHSARLSSGGGGL